MTDDKRRDADKGDPRIGTDNSPERGGYMHADTRMGSRKQGEMIADVEEAITGVDPASGRPAPERDDAQKPKDRPPKGRADALSRTNPDDESTG